MKNLRLATTLGLALITLSACQAYEGLKADVDSWDLPAALPGSESSPDALVYNTNCPQIKVMDELRAYSDFSDPSSINQNDLITRIYISNIRTACALDVSSMTVDMNINFTGTLGPRGRINPNDQPFYSYPFFVAVTDARGKVLTKEIYAANITYGSGINTQNYVENMRFILPAETRDHGAKQKIIVGFQLTPEQLEYNRDHLEEYLETLPPAVSPPVALTETSTLQIEAHPVGAPALASSGGYPGQ